MWKIEWTVPLSWPLGIRRLIWLFSLYPSVFWDLYCAAPERRDTCEHSSEAKAFHDYVSIWKGMQIRGQNCISCACDFGGVSVLYNKKMCTVSCVKDVVIIPTIAMMSAGFSMESSLFLDEDAVCLGRSALSCTWCLADWKSRSAWPKIEARKGLIIDITKLHFLKMDL